METEDLLLLFVAALLWVKWEQDQKNPERRDDIAGAVEEKIDIATEKVNEMMGIVSPVRSMRASEALLKMLKKREALRLTRYELGDGGYTWGYGHWSKDPKNLPMTITKENAEVIFQNDVVEAGENPVKRYLKVPLKQHQFDALVHMSFNLSAENFKKIAAAVNAGQGVEAIAQESLNWCKPQHRNGVAVRRAEEVKLFNTGVYSGQQ